MTDKTLKELCEAVVSTYKTWEAAIDTIVDYAVNDDGKNYYYGDATVDYAVFNACKAAYFDAVRAVEARLGTGAGSIDHASAANILAAINEAEKRGRLEGVRAARRTMLRARAASALLNGRWWTE
jgi:hypothetical protein